MGRWKGREIRMYFFIFSILLVFCFVLHIIILFCHYFFFLGLSSGSLDKMVLQYEHQLEKHDAQISIMLELLIQTPGMTTFSIWTFYNAGKGEHLNMLLLVPLIIHFWWVHCRQ